MLSLISCTSRDDGARPLSLRKKLCRNCNANWTHFRYPVPALCAVQDSKTVCSANLHSELFGQNVQELLQREYDKMLLADRSHYS